MQNFKVAYLLAHIFLTESTASRKNDLPSMYACLHFFHTFCYDIILASISARRHRFDACPFGGILWLSPYLLRRNMRRLETRGPDGIVDEDFVEKHTTGIFGELKPYSSLILV